MSDVSDAKWKNLVQNSWNTLSDRFIVGQTQQWNHYDFTEDTCHNTDAQMEADPRKSFYLLACHIQVSKAAPRMTVKPVKPWPN